MRKIKKQVLSFQVRELPLKISHFKKPKWNKIKKEIAKKIKFNNRSVSIKNLFISKTTRNWVKNQKTYSTLVKNIRACKRIYTTNYLRILKIKNLRKKVEQLICKRISSVTGLTFLTRVGKTKDAVKEIYNQKKIKLNKKLINKNTGITKKDLVTIDKLNTRNIEILNFYRQIPTFYEYDAYSKNMIMVKKIQDMSNKDLSSLSLENIF
jgi:hypothetical protein